MNVDLEAGGAFATAGLAAREIEARTHSQPDKADPEKAGEAKSATKTCANCHAPLRGRFCSSCGQASHVHRSLWHMFEEVLHGVLHFDTKSWRTIPLLFARPGLLTRRYIEGQRVRYVSPLALFLFCTFLMFFGLSMFNSSKDLVSVNNSSPEEARAELVGELDAAKQAVAQASAKLIAAETNEERDELATDLRDAITELQGADTALTIVDKVTKVTGAIDQSGSVTQGIATAAQQDPTIDAGIKAEINTGNAKLDSVVKRARDNPELAMYKLKNTAYKFSFMLIPISLPFLWLMFFWRRGVTMYDHAVFSLYSLSFMSLFALIFVGLNSLSAPTSLMGILGCVPMIHMFMQLRETYSLGIGSTLWRTFALLIIAGTVFVLFLLMVIAITVS